MKRTFTLCLLGLAISAPKTFAQPTITSSITTVPVGTIDSAYGASPTVLPGPGGAGVIWDMSTVTTVFAAKLTVVTPASTPYASTFSTATFCTKIEGTTTTYNFTKQSSVGVENLSLTYAGVGTGTDFNPNPRLSVPFPFSYTNSKSDSFQSTTSGVDTVRLTYDGYGTLKTPFYTYPNVVRIKEDYGSHYSYSWYTVSPFALVMNYASTSNNYVIVTSKVGTTGIRNTPVAANTVVYPNPMSDNAVLHVDASVFNNAFVTITDISGKVVSKVPVTSTETTIQKGGMQSGMYFYTVQNNGVQIANGKLQIN